MSVLTRANTVLPTTKRDINVPSYTKNQAKNLDRLEMKDTVSYHKNVTALDSGRSTSFQHHRLSLWRANLDVKLSVMFFKTVRFIQADGSIAAIFASF